MFPQPHTAENLVLVVEEMVKEAEDVFGCKVISVSTDNASILLIWLPSFLTIVTVVRV